MFDWVELKRKNTKLSNQVAYLKKRIRLLDREKEKLQEKLDKRISVIV